MEFITKTLKDHPGMQLKVRIYRDETVELISYQTLVLQAIKAPEDDPDATDKTYYITPMGQYWDLERVYTPTTARHLSYFLAEYFPTISYPQFKYAAEKSGEVLRAEIKPNVRSLW